MYNAFISYSHSADEKFAPALQNALQKFAKPWYKKRNLEIFRDESSLSASPHLWNNITKALDQSEHLILLASPQSENSHWVNEEVKYWLKHKSVDTILLALTEGNIDWDTKNKRFLDPDNNSLPPSLDKVFKDDPFYIDLRQSKNEDDLTLSNPIFKKEILKLAAKLHHKTPNDLASEEVTVHRRMMLIRNGAISILGFLLIIAISLGWLANANRKEAINQESIAKNQLARNYWNNAEQKKSENKLTEALLYMAEGIYNSKNKDLSKNMFFDVENLLPKYFLKNILNSESLIGSANFSPNGKLIVTTSIDSTVHFWDGLTYKEVGQGFKLDGPINSVVFNQKGDRLLIVSDYKNVEVWDISREYNMLNSLNYDHFNTKVSSKEYIIRAIFSKDEKRIITTSMDSNAKDWFPNPWDDLDRGYSFVRVWNTSDSHQIGNTITIDGKLGPVVNSPDGRIILTAGNNGIARLWDASTGNPYGSPMKHDETVNSAVFSIDGKSILTTSDDNSARIWEVSNCKQIGANMEHQYDVLDAVFSPDGNTVLTVTWNDGIAHIWNIANKIQIGSGIKTQGSNLPSDLVSLSRNELSSSNFNPVYPEALAAINSKNVIVFDLFGKQIGNELKHREKVKASFSKDGKRILTLSNGIVRIWESVNATEKISKMKCELTEMTKIRPSRSPNYALGICQDSIVYILDLIDGNHVKLGKTLKAKLKNNSFFTNGKNIVIYNEEDSKYHTWDVITEHEIGNGIEANDLYNVIFSPDTKKMMVYNEEDNKYHIWDVLNQHEIGNGLELGDLNSAVFSPDTKWLLTTQYNDYIARLWDLANGKQIQNFVMEDKIFSEDSYFTYINAFFSHDGKKIITVCNNIARYWDSETSNQIGSDIVGNNTFGSAELSNNEDWLLTTTYTADGFSGPESKIARIWNLSNGQGIGPGMVHIYDVLRATFSPNGKQVLTLSQDDVFSMTKDSSSTHPLGISFNDPARSLRLWEPNTGTQIGPAMMPNNSGYSFNRFINNGTQILSILDDGYRILDISGDADLPAELFKLQSNVCTGWRFNLETNNFEILTKEQWYKIQKEYLIKAKVHYKNCKFRENNYWSKCYPKEAAKIIDPL